MQIKDIGEQGLLKRLQKFCPPEIVGDDGAVISINPQKQLVVTTDMLVDEVHFSNLTTSPEDVGWRAAAANLSDLAAMGATPVGLTVCLGLRGDVELDWVERLYQGLSLCLETYHTPLIGGDVCGSGVVTVSITALGEVSPHQVIRRTTAQPGDVIMVTGVHGASRAGLELLLNPQEGQALTENERDYLIKAHQRPKPRLDVVEKLREFAGETRVSGMDSSDGLADAVVQICRESGVGATIEAQQIPIAESWREKISSQQALEWALYGGEDFELVLCLKADIADTLVQQIGHDAAVIGQITATPEIELVDQGKIKEISQTKAFGHFS